MSDEHASFRRILTSTSIVGGATAITIVVGVVRTKLIALAIGPAGMGLMGLLTSIMATAAAVGSMGLGFSGVRQIAAAGPDKSVARRALWLATWPLALLAALAVWIARHDIARFSGVSTAVAVAIGLTGIGAALTIIATSQLAVIQGLQRVGDLARARIYGAVASLLIGVPAVLLLGEAGIILAVLAVPAGNVLAALPYRPAPEASTSHSPPRTLTDEWRQLFSLGLVIMVTTSLSSASLVLIRKFIIQADGLEAAGLYQAAYAISAMNVALILSAMAADYFPRLSAIQADRPATAALVNQQLKAAILLGTPALLALVALAPLVLQLLYSKAFVEASPLLRWQVTGELLKLPGWALGFLLVARGDSRRFMLAEILFVVLYAGGTALLLPVVGLTGAGIAYFGAYLVYSTLLILLCRRRHAVSIWLGNLGLLGTALAALTGTTALAGWSPLGAAALGLLLAAAYFAYAARELERMTKWWKRLKCLTITGLRQRNRLPR